MTQQTDNSRSHTSSSLVVVGMGVAAGFLCAIPLLAMKNELGLLVLVVVPLIFIALWGAANRAGSKPDENSADTLSINKRRNSRLALALFALFIGPFGMAVVGVLCVLTLEINPLDHGFTIMTSTTLGLIAGVVVASAVALSAMFE